MRRIVLVLLAVVTLSGLTAFIAGGTAHAGQEGAPVFVKKPPAGYRDWKLISVAHEEANLNSLAAVLGNDVAMKAYRDGTLPFPDGTIIAALHDSFVPSDENNQAFGQAQSFVAGDPTNVQFMIKDSKKYASTGGWGFGHFYQDGTVATRTLLGTCAPCHAKAARDSVFTHYSR
jgi:cytochrome P460